MSSTASSPKPMVPPSSINAKNQPYSRPNLRLFVKILSGNTSSMAADVRHPTFLASFKAWACVRVSGLYGLDSRQAA